MEVPPRLSPHALAVDAQNRYQYPVGQHPVGQRELLEEAGLTPDAISRLPQQATRERDALLDSLGPPTVNGSGLPESPCSYGLNEHTVGALALLENATQP